MVAEPDLLLRLRQLVQDCLGKHMHTAAAFYADKLVTFSDGNPGDVYLLAQAYFVGQQYRRAYSPDTGRHQGYQRPFSGWLGCRRALHLIHSHELVGADVRFRYLAARCLAECKEFEECLRVIGESDEDEPPAVSKLRTQEGTAGPSGGAGREVGIYASICLLRGKAFAAQENMQVRPSSAAPGGVSLSPPLSLSLSLSLFCACSCPASADRVGAASDPASQPLRLRPAGCFTRTDRRHRQRRRLQHRTLASLFFFFKKKNNNCLSPRSTASRWRRGGTSGPSVRTPTATRRLRS